MISSGEYSGTGRANAYYSRGNAYANLGEQHRAIEDYDQALRLDPAFAAAYNNRANAYFKLGEHAQAIGKRPASPTLIEICA